MRIDEFPGARKTMKSFTLCAIVLISGLAAAQDFPRYEVSGGYSYGGSVQDFSLVNRLSPKGWNGTFAANMKRWMGVEFDAGGQYLSESVVVAGAPYLVNNGFYSFLAGPRLAFRRDRVTPFVHGLVGIHRSLDYAQATFPAPGTVLVPYQNAFGTAAGGGVDIAITRRVSLRTQADYLITRVGTGPTVGYENRFRALAGIVFSFGSTDGYRSRNEPSLAPTPDESSRSYRSVRAVPMQPTEPKKESHSKRRRKSSEEADIAPEPAGPMLTSPTASNVAQVPRPAPVQQTAAVQNQAVVPGQIVRGETVVRPPSPSSQQGESLGEVARRYRAQKKQSKPE